MLEAFPPQLWNRSTAAHLLKRAGFGTSPEQLDLWTSLGLDTAVDRLVDWELTEDPTAEPDWAQPAFGYPFQNKKELQGLSEDERRELFKEYQKTQRKNSQDLRERWLNRFLTTPRPLQEKLTLFWHGHFATSIRKVKISYFMWKQLDLFRRFGNGSYENLLMEVARDPAMLIWLDGTDSNDKAPNENFARELMELFTLGEGHYTEEDVKESARAFTGWRVDRFSQTATFNPKRSDRGSKKFLGQRGSFNDQDIIRIILQQEQAAQHICTKLWTFFAYENPSPQLMEALAATFRESKMELKPLLKKLFRSQEFYSAQALNNQIKSPVQWWVSSLKNIASHSPATHLGTRILTQLGQSLLEPPSVKGWDGGRTWISTSTLMLRHNTAHYMLYGGTAAELGIGDNFKRLAFANQAKKINPEPTTVAPNTEMEEQPTPEPTTKLANKLLNRSMPALTELAQLAPPELRLDRSKLINTLSERFLQNIPDPKLSAFLENSLPQKSEPVTDQELKKLLYQIMTRPEYQLT